MQKVKRAIDRSIRFAIASQGLAVAVLPICQLIVTQKMDTGDGTLIYSGTLVGASYDGEALERVYLSDVI